MIRKKVSKHSEKIESHFYKNISINIDIPDRLHFL